MAFIAGDIFLPPCKARTIRSLLLYDSSSAKVKSCWCGKEEARKELKTGGLSS